MPLQDDNSNCPDTLSPPELNPLLNPILSRHIGRWAEVYLKSPPERRELAVQQLIRELESEGPHNDEQGKAVVSSPSLRPRDTAPHLPVSDFDSIESRRPCLTCQWCGYMNRPGYKFCGRCGEQLGDTSATSLIDERLIVENGMSTNPIGAGTIGKEQRAGLARSLDGEASLGSQADNKQVRRRLERRFSSAKHAYGSLVGVVLALVLLPLAYYAWRSHNSTPSTSPLAPQVTTAATDTPRSMGTTASNSLASVTAPSALKLDTATKIETRPKSDQVSPIHGPESGRGSSDLAEARDYLQGTHGKERDAGEAVELLWRAVRKQNAEATVVLSNIYLRGEGVPKNCEQGRLLLDVAATKGRKDAAEQLKNLSAFGCE